MRERGERRGIRRIKGKKRTRVKEQQSVPGARRNGLTSLRNKHNKRG